MQKKAVRLNNCILGKRKAKRQHADRKRFYLLSRVTVTTGAVVPIDRILFVQLNSCREVLNGFVVFEEAVPDETSTVIGWRILRIELNHSVEVFERKVEAIAAYFLSHGAQMVDSLHVGGLELNGAQVVLFCLLQVVRFVPAKSSVVKRLEVVLVEFDCFRVVSDCRIEVTLLSVGKAPIVVEVSLAWFYLDRRREALDSFVEVAASVQ